MARRIHILGASGAGTTTLGRALSRMLGVCHLDTDDYFWAPTDPPYRLIRDLPERLELLGAGLEAHDAWVLSGSLCGWGDPLIPRFELVVFVRTPTAVRLRRLAERERLRFGADALAPGGPMHGQHREFMNWAAAYDEGGPEMRSLRRHETWLAGLPCPVLRVNGTTPPTELAASVRTRLTVAGT